MHMGMSRGVREWVCWLSAYALGIQETQPSWRRRTSRNYCCIKSASCLVSSSLNLVSTCIYHFDVAQFFYNHL